MKRWIAAFAANPVAANLLMLGVLVAGFASIPSLRQETFPNVTFDVISVGVAYPGAAPDEVEQAVCIPVEEAIQGLLDGLGSYGQGSGGRERVPGPGACD